MKAFLIAGLLVLLAAGGARAGSEVFSWDAVPTATSYDLEQSTDTALSWSKIGSVDAATCSAGRCAVTVNLPAAGVVLLRIGARNAAGVTMRYGSGIWHCESCKPPANASNVGVQ